MKIKKIIKKREKKYLTLQDFLRLKKDGDIFEKMRQDAKEINFGFIFNRSGVSFANDLEVAWPIEKAEEYIKNNHLEDELDKIIEKLGKRFTLEKCKYIVCSEDIKNKFFKTYPGLLKRIIREKKYALDNGFVRSWHGHFRHFPELRFVEINEDYNIIKDDMKIYGRFFSNIFNMISNSSIQNYEACLVMSSINELHNWLKENKLKSFIFNMIHDSIDLVIYKPEVKLVCEKLIEICVRERKNQFGIPQAVEITLSDLNDSSQYYKNGKDWKSFIQ